MVPGVIVVNDASEALPDVVAEAVDPAPDDSLFAHEAVSDPITPTARTTEQTLFSTALSLVRSTRDLMRPPPLPRLYVATAASSLSEVAAASLGTPRPGWRNWQTRGTQNPVGFGP